MAASAIVDQLLDVSGISHLAEEPVGLHEALLLFSRIVPDLEDELRKRADMASDPLLAGRLTTLAAEMSRHLRQPAPIRDGAALFSGYAVSDDGAQ